jgi:hypothetical protein
LPNSDGPRRTLDHGWGESIYFLFALWEPALRRPSKTLWRCLLLEENRIVALGAVPKAADRERRVERKAGLRLGASLPHLGSEPVAIDLAPYPCAKRIDRTEWER